MRSPRWANLCQSIPAAVGSSDWGFPVHWEPVRPQRGCERQQTPTWELPEHARAARSGQEIPAIPRTSPTAADFWGELWGALGQRLQKREGFFGGGFLQHLRLSSALICELGKRGEASGPARWTLPKNPTSFTGGLRRRKGGNRLGCYTKIIKIYEEPAQQRDPGIYSQETQERRSTMSFLITDEQKLRSSPPPPESLGCKTTS